MGRRATERHGYSKSRGQTALAEAVQAAFPLSLVKQDVTLRKYAEDLGYPWQALGAEYGRSLSRLDADILLLGPEPAIFEFHGRQHFEFVAHFHGDKEGWEAAKERDFQKHWVASRLGIPFVVFRDGDPLDGDSVSEALRAARERFEPLPGYVPCPACGRAFPQDELDGPGCPACRRDRRKAEDRERRAAVAAEHRPAVSEADRELARTRRREERERAKAAPVSEEQAARQEAARQRARDAAKARRQELSATKPAPSPEQASRQQEYELRRKEQERAYREEQRRRQKEAPPSAATEEAKAREKAYRREAAERYRNSDAAKAAKAAAKERAKAWRESVRGSRD